MGWHELLAADRSAIFDFYGELFGWQKASAENDPADVYQVFAVGGQTIGGMLTKLPSVSQPCWLYYFNVDDIGAAAKRVNAGGGRVLQGPIELPDGCWIVRCTDPQGALFALQGAWDQKRTERRSASEVGWSARWGGISSQGRVVLPKTKREASAISIETGHFQTFRFRRLHGLCRWRMRYFRSAAIIAAFCSQGPGLRMSPETLPAASLTKAIRV